MRRVSGIWMAWLLCGAAAMGQQSPASNGDVQELKQELKEVMQRLDATQTELHAAQDQIKTLSSEVETLRAGQTGVTTPEAGAPPAETQNTDIADLKQEEEILKARVDQQYQTKVESGSKYRVRLSGLVLFNASTTRGAVDDQDVPMLAEAHTPGATGGDISATMRQTLVNVDVFGPEVWGAKTSGSLQMDFFGGFPNTLDGVAMGVVRMRVARAQLDWQKWSLTIGQDKPFISPWSPTSLAAIGTPDFGYSGNLWTWTPQVVVERRWMPEDSLFGMKTQIGMLDPFDGELPSDSFGRYPEAGEASRTPAFAGRQSFEFGSGDQKAIVGVSGYGERQDWAFGKRNTGYAATLDWKVPLGTHFETSGLLYRGQAIGGLWGGIGTSVVFDGSEYSPLSHFWPVDTVGGWSQLKFKPGSKLEFNAAFGEDSPYANEVRHYNETPYYLPYLRNWTTMFNVIERPRSNLMISLEYRHLNSVEFSGRQDTAEHLNLGVGVSF